MIDLDYFCWRERSHDAASGAERLLIPWSDPQVYEYPADGMFVTADEAEIWRQEFAEDEEWVLVHYVGTVTTPASTDRYTPVLIDAWTVTCALLREMDDRTDEDADRVLAGYPDAASLWDLAGGHVDSIVDNAVTDEITFAGAFETGLNARVRELLGLPAE